MTCFEAMYLRREVFMKALLFLSMILGLLNAEASPCSHIADSELIPGTIELNADCTSLISSSGRCIMDIELAADAEQDKSGLAVFVDLVGTSTDVCGQELEYGGSKGKSIKKIIRFMGWPKFNEN